MASAGRLCRRCGVGQRKARACGVQSGVLVCGLACQSFRDRGSLPCSRSSGLFGRCHWPGLVSGKAAILWLRASRSSVCLSRQSVVRGEVAEWLKAAVLKTARR